MPEPCVYQHQRAIAVWETANNPCTPPEITVDPFDTVVSADTRPMFRRVVRIGQRFGDAMVWEVSYTGKGVDGTKPTYIQAYANLALSAYYPLTKTVQSV